ncbi:hypothetical protein XENOCAPTIV_003763 [Xenoophorus captivus]|uniref:Uncharacterized protein n=1 Tax=Xenoophorus captivus TaxID=1517983 RepID=A0ABV0QHF0_9TELE
MLDQRELLFFSVCSDRLFSSAEKTQSVKRREHLHFHGDEHSENYKRSDDTRMTTLVTGLSIKMRKILNAERRVGEEGRAVGLLELLQRKQRPSAGAAGLFPSLFVETRADFSHIKVVNDRTGCHRFACSVSWAWFLLWAGRAALHFYSNPPKTIPCVIRVRNLSEAEKINLEGLDAGESGFISADPLHRYTRVTPALQR